MDDDALNISLCCKRKKTKPESILFFLWNQIQTGAESNSSNPKSINLMKEAETQNNIRTHSAALT